MNKADFLKKKCTLYLEVEVASVQKLAFVTSINS